MTDPRHRRAAIIGAGLMGRWHADAVTRIGGAVTVIVDPDGAARRALGARYPRAVLLPELDPERIARDATVAHVCTPGPTHVALIMALVEEGVHALVEKPFTDDAPSTRAVLASAERRGVKLCPVHQFLFQDGVQQMVEWLPTMGTLRRVEFSTCSAGATDDPVSQDALVAEILPHPLSLVAALLRAPVAEIGWQVVHPSAGEFRAVGSVGAAVIDVAISAHGRPTENTLRIVADGGTATADLFHGFAVRYAPTVSRAAKVLRPFSRAARDLSAATVNLARRTARAEAAYPGLRELVRAFYAATEAVGPAPITPDAIADVASARDTLIGQARLRRD